MPKSNIVYALRPRRQKPLPAAQIAIEAPTRIITARKPNPKAAGSSAIVDDLEPSDSVRAFFAKMVRPPG